MTSPMRPDVVRAIFDTDTGEIHVVDGEDLALTLTTDEALALAAQMVVLASLGEHP